MGRVRSPLALAASILCLVSAFALGTALVHDAEGSAAVLMSAEEGDTVRIKGEFERFTPSPDWDHVTAYLEDASYFVRTDVPGWVIVTGLEAGLGDHRWVVEGPVVLESSHPADGQSIVVIRAEELSDPVIFG